MLGSRNNGEDAKNVYQRPIRTKEQTEMNNPLEGVSSRVTEAEEAEIKLPTVLDHRESKGMPEKNLPLFNQLS